MTTPTDWEKLFMPLVEKWRIQSNALYQGGHHNEFEAGQLAVYDWCADELLAHLPGVVELLEAGQAMREGSTLVARRAWDAAKSKLLGKGAE